MTNQISENSYEKAQRFADLCASQTGVSMTAGSIMIERAPDSSAHVLRVSDVNSGDYRDFIIPATADEVDQIGRMIKHQKIMTDADIQEQKQAEYFENGGEYCFHCGGSDIIETDNFSERGVLVRDMLCSECDKTWQDELSFIRAGVV